MQFPSSIDKPRLKRAEGERSPLDRSWLKKTSALLGILVLGAAPPKGDEGFLAQRASKGPGLVVRGPSPQPYGADKPPEGVSRVAYKSPVGKLFAWYASPPGASAQKKVPAVIYAHGGYAFGAQDFEDARPFLEGGAALMTPTWRGENGNPGYHEQFWGELDDLRAALRWLRARPEVDANRIFVFGHSAGGVLSALIALTDAPVRSTGSAGGLYDASIFDEGRTVFEFRDEEAKRLRVFPPHVPHMERPHVAYVGLKDPMAASGTLRAFERGTQQPLLKVYTVPGDHFSMLAPAVLAFAKRIGLKVSSEVSPKPATLDTLKTASSLERAEFMHVFAPFKEIYCSMDLCLGGTEKTCPGRAQERLDACGQKLPKRIPLGEYEQTSNTIFSCMLLSLKGPPMEIQRCAQTVLGG